MSDSIIKVEGLGKKYIISHEGTRGSYTALRDVISNKAKGLIKKSNGLASKEEFWALKDVSFEIKKGEAVGIIGRNGAGKSTLLKILSRITEPTTGRIEINGRVASLLEVGTGFHPELTGRENIFLNGAILGMGRAEIRSKFDEIVDFSGVEKFLDTPVKRYSSGMYVRLAFAVAAHLEPEILVVDEVLAVGDSEFQKKCMGKMDEVSKAEGKTILFVSHNLSAITNLCSKGILLDQGQTVYGGDIGGALTKYSSLVNSNIALNNKVQKNAKLIFNLASIDSATMKDSNVINIGDDLRLKINFQVFDKIENLILNTNIYNSNNELVAHLVNEDDEVKIENLVPGKQYEADIVYENLMLTPGIYTIDFWAGGSYFSESLYQFSKSAISFEVVQGPLVKRSTMYPSHALMFVKTKWNLNEVEKVFNQ